MTPKTRSRITIIAVVLLFSLPPLLAILMQTPWFRYEPTATRNHGEFIEPLLSLEPYLSSPATQEPLFVNRQNIWSILYLMPASCDQECAERVDLMLRIRLTTGRYMARARLMVRVPEGAIWPPEQFDAAALEEIVAVREQADLNALLPELADGTRATTFILDPEGNALLHYPEPLQGTDLRRDYRHLLNWSKTGR